MSQLTAHQSWSRLPKPGTFAICFLIFTVILSGSLVTGSDYFVRLTGEKLTLHANQVPLRDLLKDLQSQGVVIQADPSINPRISLTVHEKPIDRVLASILKSYNYSLVWEKAGNSPESELSLVEIQIFQRGKKNRIEPLVESNNLLIVQGDDGLLYVKNSLLVHLNSSVNRERLSKILGLLGATVTDSFQELGIVRLQLPDSLPPQQAIEILTGFDEIAGAEPDYAHPLETNRIISTSTIPAEFEVKTDASGSAVVAVLDSGLSQQYAGSPFVTGVYDAFSNSQETSDSVGHGTQMSLIASGVVDPLGVQADKRPSNPIVAVRAFDDNGFTSTYTLMRSIDYSIAAKAQVLSMSWGSEHSSPMLEKVVKYATDNGLIIVAAAGNSPTGKPVYPAAYKNVIGVGALMPNGSVWDQSNFGEFVSVYAPGIAQMPVGHNGNPGTYAGTSISTAYMANQIAQILEDQPDTDTEQIISILKTNK